MRFYDFAVKWQNGKGEVKTFSIAAKHIHPNHFRKGTASDNRKDIKVRVLNVAEIWRRRKLKEQEALREAIRNSNVTRFEISPYLERWLGPHAVFYVPDVLLFEPAQCGRDCRKGWIEAILVGHVTAEVARFIAQLYFDNGPYEAAVEAARVGKSLSELERCFAREEE